MSRQYKDSQSVPNSILAERLRALADFITKPSKREDERLPSEFYMRIPAEPDHDADLVMSEAARRLMLIEATPAPAPADKPFMYAIADIEGRAVLDEVCVAEHPSELELSDEDEGRGKKIVPVYTGPQIEAMREALKQKPADVATVSRDAVESACDLFVFGMAEAHGEVAPDKDPEDEGWPIYRQIMRRVLEAYESARGAGEKK